MKHVFQFKRSARPLLLFALAAFFSLAWFGCGEDAEVTITGPILSNHRPDVRWGGRIIALSAHPANSDIVMAASESAGLWRSEDGGKHWLRFHPNRSYYISDLKHGQRDRITWLIVTSRGDLSKTPHGGIWRSSGPTSMIRPATGGVPARGPRCPGNASAYEISVDHGSTRIYVATDCGIAISDDQGENWRYVIPDPELEKEPDSLQDRMINVHAAGGGLVYAVGRNGVYASNDSGDSWTKSGSPDFGRVNFRDATPRIASAPENPGIAFLAMSFMDKHRLYLSMDEGQTWTEIYQNDPDGRLPMVHTTRPEGLEQGSFDLYYGTGKALFRKRVTDPATLLSPITWEELYVDHADPNDMAFDLTTREPLLVGTDGGVHSTTDGGANWRVLGGGINGLNALQLYEVEGQMVYNAAGEFQHTDLYIGTQDNGFYSSQDNGGRWAASGDSEGGNMSLLRRVNDHERTRITGFYYDDPSVTFIRKKHFEDKEIWPDPETKGSDASILSFGKYVQVSIDQSESPEKHYLELTDDHGGSWRKVQELDKNNWGMPRVVGPETDPTVYLSVAEGTWNANGVKRTGLRRIRNVLSGTPRMANVTRSFGSLGYRAYQFVWEPVYGVNPMNPSHLLVPDIVANKMRYSLDGGASWQDDDVLTNVVTNNGEFHFHRRHHLVGTDIMVTEVSFLPENPNHIMVGTKINGIAWSRDGGLTWEKVPGSEDIPHITGFFWDYEQGQVYVSSFGAGLWKLNIGREVMARIPETVRRPGAMVPLPQVDLNQPADPPLVLRGSNSVNGIPLVHNGVPVRLEGMGYSSDPQQEEILLFVDGREEAVLQADANGRITHPLPGNLAPGGHTLEVRQGYDIRRLEFAVVTLDGI